MIAANPKQVEQYKAGKTTVLGFLVGQVMKASKGQANPGGGERTAAREAVVAPELELLKRNVSTNLLLTSCPLAWAG